MTEFLFESALREQIQIKLNTIDDFYCGECDSYDSFDDFLTSARARNSFTY